MTRNVHRSAGWLQFSKSIGVLVVFTIFDPQHSEAFMKFIVSPTLQQRFREF